MPSVRRLMREANPVPGDRAEDGARAEARLAELMGGGRTPAPARNPAPRTARAVLVWAAVAVVAAGVVGAVVLREAAPPSGSSTADQPFYSTTAELEESAEAIVRGTVTSTRGSSGETVATVAVGKVATGTPAVGSSIRVVFSASGPEQADGIHDGGDYVLLLQARDATSWNLVNTTQGYYTVSPGRLVPTADNPVELSPPVLAALGLA
ncbi:hypothetical protein ACQP2X_13955 [Actinoplanes sp. CA-131856]